MKIVFHLIDLFCIMTRDITDLRQNSSDPCCVNTSETVSEAYILWLLNQEQFQINLPCIIFYICAITIGVSGNGLVIFIFGFKFRRNTVHVFIMWLAIFDISGCFLLIYETLDKRLPMYSGQLPVICKMVRYLEVGANSGSSLLLVCIAFDRYYKVCKPLKRFSMRRTKQLIAGIIITVVIVALPMLLFHGTETVETPFEGITGKDCADDDTFADSPLPSIYFIFIFLVILTILITLIVLYSIIFVAIIRWKNNEIGESMKRTRTRVISKADSTTSMEDSVYTTEKCHKFPNKPDVTDQPENNLSESKSPVDETKTNEENNDGASLQKTFSSEHLDTVEELGVSFSNKTSIENSPDNGHSNKDLVIDSSVLYNSYKNSLKFKMKIKINSGSKNGRKWRRSRSRERISPTTVTFALVTLLYIISYIPTILIESLGATGVLREENLSNSVKKVVVIANSSYFANGALNPIIYGLFNRAFRKELLVIFKGS